MESRIKKQVNIAVEQNGLTISLQGIVTARSIDSVLRGLSKNNEQVFSLGRNANLVVDLSKATLILPSGAVSLVCLCSALMTNRTKCTQYTLSEIFLRLPSENILSYLTRIGFFRLMSAKTGLLGYGHLIQIEEQLQDRNRRERAQPNVYGSPSKRDNPIVWPMQIITEKPNHSSYRHFEDDCQRLVNRAADHFKKLFTSPHFNFQKADVHGFLYSIYELYMNVYEHSGNSWGLTMIHGRPRYGTFVCCYDIGNGFKEGLAGSPNVKDVIETDDQAIRWALVEGHSRKVGGSGLGLKVVERFILERGGTMEIRSGESLFQKGGKTRTWRAYRVPWFPGSQINMFVPVKLNGASNAS